LLGIDDGQRTPISRLVQWWIGRGQIGIGMMTTQTLDCHTDEQTGRASIRVERTPRQCGFEGETSARVESVLDGDAEGLDGDSASAASSRLGCDPYVMLLAMVCHELRQPLQVIRSSHDILAGGLRRGPKHKLLARAERATTQLADAINLFGEAVLLREKMGADDQEAVRLAVLIPEVAAEFREAATEKGLTLRVITPDANALSHRSLLRTMLRNLVRNAIDYTPRGGRVLIACRRRGPLIRIEVRDNGVGIRDAHVAGIFEAFRRIDVSRQDGLGLGLFIVKSAAGLLGHEVEARSSVGGGSCFTLVVGAALTAGTADDPHGR
jgi:two-component system phosphate regulon sensor histidine kinase PhoR